MNAPSLPLISLDALRILDGWAADCAGCAKHHAPIVIRKPQGEHRLLDEI